MWAVTLQLTRSAIISDGSGLQYQASKRAGNCYDGRRVSERSRNFDAYVLLRGRVVKGNPAYRSQTCSACGAVDADCICGSGSSRSCA